jgi:uncharacterized protein
MANVFQQHEAQLRAPSGRLAVSLSRTWRTSPASAAQAPTSSAGLRWPDFTALWPEIGGGSAFKQLKTHIRLWRARTLGPTLVNESIAPSDWQPLFVRDAARLYPAISHFMDRRWTMPERFRRVANDLAHARIAFGASVCDALANDQSITLAQINTDVQLVLEPNTVSYHEGLWALSLRSATGTRLYTLSFAFLARNQVLIGTLQGPSFEADCRDALRTLTKQCHGLRPAPLLIAALQQCAPQWGVAAIEGIDPEHHIKGRWNLRNRRLRFDYRAFYRELGGAREASGYWRLPTAAGRRDCADIPTRKRAEYRRRYALLDTMARSIRDTLSHLRFRASAFSKENRRNCAAGISQRTRLNQFRAFDAIVARVVSFRRARSLWV